MQVGGMHLDRHELFMDEIQGQNKSSPEMSPSDVWNWYRGNKTETCLAQAFATASNEFWWSEDNQFECDNIPYVHQSECESKETWQLIMLQLEQEIIRMLTDDCFNSAENDQKNTLISFMQRNGYQNENGWWAIGRND